MNMNFEEEYISLMLGSGCILEIDRETALDIAKQIQDFYEDGFCDDYDEEEEDLYNR